MRILYLNAIEQHYGWGAEYFLNKALIGRGIETYTIDFRINRNRLSKRLLTIKGEFDIVLLQRGDYFPLEIASAILKPKVFLFTELIQRCSDADHLFESNLFDAYLVRGPKCKEVLSARGSPDPAKIDVFLSSFDQHTFYRREVRQDFDCLFVGSMTPRRESIIRELSKDFSVNVFRAFGEEASNLFSRAKIILNIHAEDFLDTETRVYEVLGSGAFLLSERLSDENPLTPGKHYVQANTLEDLKSSICYYLNHEDVRRKIATEGHLEALSKHTYDARAVQLESLFKRLIGHAVADGSRFNQRMLRSYAIREAFVSVKNRYKEYRRGMKSFLKRALGTDRRVFRNSK
jgi:hypothetical protein